MAKRGEACGLARGPLVKNAGRADLFNPLTRPALACNPHGPVAGRGRAGRGGLAR